MATAEPIEVENLGAIKQGRFPTLQRGGVIEYSGPPGCGKSTMLDALESAVTGKGKIPLRDGATKGRLKAFGVDIKLNPHRNTRTGEPQLEFIGGRFSVADIVEPGIADPQAADSKRIKALVQLAGGEPDPAVFAGLFGNDAALFAAVVDESVADLSDLVAMAEKVKRDCEKVAREEEKAADTATGKATALKQTADGIDLKAESDAAKLNAAYVAAIQEESRLKAEATAQQSARDASAKAKKSLEDAEANSQLPSVAEAQKAETAALKALGAASDACRAAYEAYEKAKEAKDAADAKAAKCQQELKAAKEFDQLSESWREQIAAGDALEGPSREDLEQASARVAEARAAQERGVEIRKAMENANAAKLAAAEAEKHATAAKTLRTIAGKTDDVLSAQVAKLGTPLRVDDGRLLLTTDRGPTFFGELSDGQRWKLALDIAIDVLGEHGLIFIPQWAWGEQPPSIKKAIAEQAREHGVLIYTAVVTDGEGIEANEYV